ncbi:MAG: hypothetical protein RLZZ44_967 [Bacteroidota bacterium]|jgi:uncharacterized protein (DUF1800 family)
MSNKLSRRQLFKLIVRKYSNGLDPLLEKYRRKIYNGRHYVDPTSSSTIANRKKTITSGILPYTGSWTEKEAIHLLKRTLFGFKISDVNLFVSGGMNNSINQLLNFTNSSPTPPVNYYQNVFNDEGGIPYGADWTNHAFSSNSVGSSTNYYRDLSLSSWNTGQVLNQENTIREKMLWFWYHFIPIDLETVRGSSGSNSARICYDYFKFLRLNATGNFKAIIRNIATQPAMMYYLNNQANTKTAPDENFAREIMELFTLGKDPLSQYTESDVVQAAKVLTGWRVQNLTQSPTTTSFVSSLHDTSNKTFSSFFNNTVISSSGSAELDAFISMLFSKEQVVSEYICRRLYRYFVYYDIDAAVESNVIQPLAKIFVASNWEIKPVLQALFKSEHFFDMANRGVYIKSPFDLVLGSLRTFNIAYNVADASNFDAQYSLWKYFNYSVMKPMEQSMGDVPNVSGWNAFYQAPSFHEYWINSNTVQKRYSFINTIFNGYSPTFNGLKVKIEVDVIAWVSQFPTSVIENPDQLVNECIKYLLPIDISATIKESLKIQNLLSNQTTNSYWTTAWLNYKNAPTNTTYTAVVKTRLKGLLLSIAQLAEYQLM